MSIGEMKLVILDGLETLVDMLKSHAELLGVDVESIYRTYDPEAEKDNLDAPPVDGNGESTGQAGTPVIIVYLRDADVEEIEQMSGVNKKIAVSAALMARVPTEQKSAIDPLTEKFEILQNVLAMTNVIKTADEQGFQLVDLQTSDVVNLEFLQESKVVLYRIDFTLATIVEGDFEIFTVTVPEEEDTEEENEEESESNEEESNEEE